MFYLLSKVFWIAAQPLSVILMLMLAGTVLFFFGRRRLGIFSFRNEFIVDTFTCS